MRFSSWVGPLLLITLALGRTASRADGDPTLDSPKTLAFTDGTRAAAEDFCGAGDVCATITLAGGDVLTVYNLGGPKCQPFRLKIVRTHSGAEVFSYEALTNRTPDTQGFFGETVCGHFVDTTLTMDNARLKMGIFLNNDGTLSVRFGPGKHAEANVIPLNGPLANPTLAPQPKPSIKHKSEAARP